MDHRRGLGTYDTLNVRGIMRLISVATPSTAAVNSWLAEKMGPTPPLLAQLADATGISTGEKLMAAKLFRSPFSDHVSLKIIFQREIKLR